MAAYAALRPDLALSALPAAPLSGLSARAAVTLNFLTLRAQRPLYLTAGNLFNLTLVLYLSVRLDLAAGMKLLFAHQLFGYPLDDSKTDAVLKVSLQILILLPFFLLCKDNLLNNCR